MVACELPLKKAPFKTRQITRFEKRGFKLILVDYVGDRPAMTDEDTTLSEPFI